MMNVDDMREIIPVTFGARAIALSLVIWHLGSDNDTGMMLIGFFVLDYAALLLEEVSNCCNSLDRLISAAVGWDGDRCI